MGFLLLEPPPSEWQGCATRQLVELSRAGPRPPALAPSCGSGGGLPAVLPSPPLSQRPGPSLCSHTTAGAQHLSVHPTSGRPPLNYVAAEPPRVSGGAGCCHPEALGG